MNTTMIACLCGAVELELSGEPIAQFYCHCDDCQAIHSAAYIKVAMYQSDCVKVVSGNPGGWKLRNNQRTTCKDCGTRIFAEIPGMGVRGVNGYLLPSGGFRPAFHIQCHYAVLPVKDGLPHFKYLPAQFGGSDETVNW